MAVCLYVFGLVSCELPFCSITLKVIDAPQWTQEVLQELMHYIVYLLASELLSHIIIENKNMTTLF